MFLQNAQLNVLLTLLSMFYISIAGRYVSLKSGVVSRNNVTRLTATYRWTVEILLDAAYLVLRHVDLRAATTDSDANTITLPRPRPRPRTTSPPQSYW